MSIFGLQNANTVKKQCQELEHDLQIAQQSLDAINEYNATIAFAPDGTILNASPRFCAAVGYSLEQIIGKHHRIFCNNAYSSTPQYSEF